MENNGMRRAGAMLVVLITLFLALDAAMKVAGTRAAVEATGMLGFSPVATRLLGAVLAVSTLIYVVPATRVLGAILVTGYLGGAVAVRALHGSPVPTHVLFGVYVGVAMWGSIWLRSPAVRRLLPLGRSTAR